MSTTPTEIDRKIYDIVSEYDDVDKDNVANDSRFVEDLLFDPLDLVELIMECEDTFVIKISNKESEHLSNYLETVGEFAEFVCFKQNRNSGTPVVMLKRHCPEHPIGTNSWDEYSDGFILPHFRPRDFLVGVRHLLVGVGWAGLILAPLILFLWVLYKAYESDQLLPLFWALFHD